MQNGARSHKTKENIELLAEHFFDRVLDFNFADITEQGIDWPAYSSDLIPLDYFLWST